MTWECFYHIAYEMNKIGFSVHGVLWIGKLYSVFIPRCFSSKECGDLVDLLWSEVKWSEMHWNSLFSCNCGEKVGNKQYVLISKQLDAQFLLCIFISILYLFRATLCSSSGESIVSIQHLVYVSLCRWPSGMEVGKSLPSFVSYLHAFCFHLIIYFCVSH